MIIKQIKLSLQAKERLSRLKGKTGIKNWNILCRWAFCYSLKEDAMPFGQEFNPTNDSNLEMSWYTFAGEYSELYEALLKAWCIARDISLHDENLSYYFRLHLERGIAYLSGTNFIKSIDDLLNLVIAEVRNGHLSGL